MVSTQTGYVTSFDALTAGLLAMRAGAGRAVKSDVLDLDAGLKIFKKIEIMSRVMSHFLRFCIIKLILMLKRKAKCYWMPLAFQMKK